MKNITLRLTRIFTSNYSLKIAFLGLLTAVHACKSPDDLGLDLDLNEFESDTLIIDDIRVQTQREDSLRTDNINFHVLGSINDSVFGPSQASIYSQLSLNGAIAFPNNAEVDSIILQMAFIDYYGDLQDDQDFAVYELKHGFDAERDYYNTSSLKLGDKIGQTKNFRLDSSNGKLRINVTKLWGRNAFRAGQSYDQTDDFQDDFKGIAVVPQSNMETNQGIIYYFNLVSLESYMNVHYHYYTTSGSRLEREEAIAELQFQTDAEVFSSFSHDYSGKLVEDYIDADSSNANRAFVQAFGGTYTSIDISALQSLIDSPLIAVHKAELVLPCDCDLHDVYLKPIPFLDIKYVAENGNLTDLPDKSKVYWVRAYNGGQNAYVFNITNHAQQVINNYRFNEEYSDNGLTIKAVKNEPIPFSAGRFVLKGSRTKRPQGSYMRIFYSKIDQP